LSSYAGIKQAEDVMGSLLTEYLGSPQQDIAASENNSEINDTSNHGDILDCSENNSGKVDSLIQKSENDESQQSRSTPVDLSNCGSHGEPDEADGEKKCEEASSANDEPTNATSANCLEHKKTCQDDTSALKNDVLASTACQFKNVVAIVDPPRVGLHPTVSKF
jgi:tRNA (uracil-5-)-methyltransferase